MGLGLFCVALDIVMVYFDLGLEFWISGILGC